MNLDEYIRKNIYGKIGIKAKVKGAITRKLILASVFFLFAKGEKNIS